ncbi:hypothetical protein HOE41_03690 [Candidatus Woesearchaeota archaeon]|nr:hypothetical protein [Candidatus Woesearchaeota archaeon]
METSGNMETPGNVTVGPTMDVNEFGTLVGIFKEHVETDTDVFRQIHMIAKVGILEAMLIHANDTSSPEVMISSQFYQHIQSYIDRLAAENADNGGGNVN